ncbi:hypothetical protein AAG570_008171 [Ranatra chinensis]|uniref:Uncharacterized protein n=1 Tax=Ranatra chinensis TaxID=642074 RepID=A0ABD0XSE1_9HEMI
MVWWLAYVTDLPNDRRSTPYRAVTIEEGIPKTRAPLCNIGNLVASSSQKNAKKPFISEITKQGFDEAPKIKNEPVPDLETNEEDCDISYDELFFKNTPNDEYHDVIPKSLQYTPDKMDHLLGFGWENYSWRSEKSEYEFPEHPLLIVPGREDFDQIPTEMLKHFRDNFEEVPFPYQDTS